MRLANGNMGEAERDKVAIFANWLLDIGNGSLGNPDESDPKTTSWIDIPDNHQIPDDENRIINLIRFIYDDDTLQNPTPQKLQEKVIVCPKNEIVDIVNAKVMSMIPRKTYVYGSYDEALPHGHDGGEVEMLTMATTGEMDSNCEEKGKMILTEPEITNIEDLSPTDSNKIIEVIVY
ncbi:DNA helicase [Tanacetum coccineum]